MWRTIYKSKIHSATITRIERDYEGSIGIDAILMQKADILPNERVQVLNLDTGARFETYCIPEEPGSGSICLYGPATHLGKVGQRLFILSYIMVEDKEARKVKPKIIYVDARNRIKSDG